MPLSEAPKPTPQGNVEWFLYWILDEVQNIRELLEQDFGFSILRDNLDQPLQDMDGNDFLDGA